MTPASCLLLLCICPGGLPKFANAAGHELPREIAELMFKTALHRALLILVVFVSLSLGHMGRPRRHQPSRGKLPPPRRHPSQPHRPASRAGP